MIASFQEKTQPAAQQIMAINPAIMIKLIAVPIIQSKTPKTIVKKAAIISPPFLKAGSNSILKWKGQAPY